MIDEIEIRPAKANDAQGIAACLAELNYPTPAEQVARRLADIARADGVALVAVEGQEILGVITAQRTSMLHRHADDARITTLAVAAHTRGQGIGRRLLLEAERWARKNGCARTEVTSGNNRETAHGFYRHIGYEQTSLRFSKHV